MASKAQQIRSVRKGNVIRTGSVGGKDIAEEATDKEILALARAQDRIAKLHNQIFERAKLKRKKRGK